jgi:predicted O-methyltransferase YrrM/SAM-dependent methyltransferase
MLEGLQSNELYEELIQRMKPYHGGAEHPDKFRFFHAAIQEIAIGGKPLDYLEIGSQNGVSMTMVAFLLTKFDALGSLTSVDPYLDEGYLQTPPWSKETIKAPPGIASMKRARAVYGHMGMNVELIRDRSVPALAGFMSNQKGFDLILVDGNHEGLEPMIDTALAISAAKPGAVLMLDDIMWPDIAPIVQICGKHLSEFHQSAGKSAFWVSHSSPPPPRQPGSALRTGSYDQGQLDWGRYNRHIEWYAERVKANPDNLWGQVGSSERGHAYENRIGQTIQSILNGLQLQESDVLLDLGCGNGALTDRIFDHCAGGLGVDLCDALIEVARAKFEQPSRQYMLADLCGYAATEPRPARFTKGLCHSAFQYLWPDDASRLLGLLRDRFQHLQRLFVGGLPDRDKIEVFLDGGQPPADYADNPESNLGIWYTRDGFVELGDKCGWDVVIGEPPPWDARFRFEAVLVRR